MKNSPAFQFYPQDFLSDLNVKEMSMKERGIYITALCHCWIENGLPADSRVVQGWFNQAPSVARCFVEKDGSFRNPRLDEEVEKQRRWAEKSRIGGLHSAENKRHFKGGSRVVQPKANSSSSSSSSSSEEHKNVLIRDDRTRSEFDPLFDEFWSGYPKKVSKTVAREKFMVIARKGEIPALIQATRGYMDHLKAERVQRNFEKEPMHPATFLSKDRWRDFVDFKYEPEL